MLFRLFACIGLLTIAATAMAQETKKFTAPDYKTIQKVIKDKTSSAYYPKLLARYEKNDTTLTEQQIHTLYYGSHFYTIPGASKFNDLHYMDSIKAINSKEQASDQDRKDLIRYYMTEHKGNPFDLRALNSLFRLYGAIHDPKSDLYLYKLRKIALVIMASGDGLSVNSGFHVSSVADEYAMLGILGFEETGNQKLVDNRCDYLEVKENEYKVEGLYFNVEQMLIAFNKSLK